MNSLERRQLLRRPAASEGFDTTTELIEHCIVDSVSPGICTTPGCTGAVEVEPDQDAGWCEVCHQNSVASALILAGLI